MDLKRIMRNRIAEEVFGVYSSGWAVLVYDSEAAMLIHSIFTRSDLLAYDIMTSAHISEEREVWDFPVIYFLNCNSQASAVINSEFSAKKYSAVWVCSLSEPEGLNKLIKHKVLENTLNALEERVFLCPPERLLSLESALEARASVNYLPSMLETAEMLASRGDWEDEITLLLIDRACDLYTPLMQFFTFASIMHELNPDEKFDDPLYPEVRHRHLAEVGGLLQSHIKKLKLNMQKLSKEKVDASELSKMAVEAPKNIKVKDALAKYSKYLNEALKRLEFLKELVEAEQVLSTEFDKHGRRAKRGLDYFFGVLGDSKYSKEDKVRFLYLVKTKGLSFTETEADILSNMGFSPEDISLEIDCSQNIKRSGNTRYQYDMSRYIPILNDLVTGFVQGKSIFQSMGRAAAEANSLRKSFMLTCEKRSMKKIVVVYIKGGIAVEECRLAYSLSQELGIEVLCGSDKIVSPSEFVKDLKNRPVPKR